MLGLFYCFCLCMKLKQQPADFIVEEIPDFTISSEKDEHTIFLLQKQEIDTFDAIRQIAKRLRISLFEIGYAGLKDKHALARQYISIPTHYNVQELKMDSLTLTFVGYYRKKIKIGDLAGNRFTIIVRDVRKMNLLIFLRERRLSQHLVFQIILIHSGSAASLITSSSARK